MIDTVAESVEPFGLMLSGLCHAHPTDPTGAGTVALLSPSARFWEVFSTSPEYQDGAAHPMDRWSARMIDALARAHQAQALYPFGGPPYLPFMSWALRSGEAFVSPIHFLVHEQLGLWLSWRGALFWGERFLPLPERTGTSPCASCTDQPCRSACPVGAFTDAGYDVAACHGWLDSSAESCMSTGCATRAACPLSRPERRPQALSRFHMRAFHPKP